MIKAIFQNMFEIAPSWNVSDIARSVKEGFFLFSFFKRANFSMDELIKKLSMDRDDFNDEGWQFQLD
jgi:hypothetical protein